MGAPPIASPPRRTDHTHRKGGRGGTGIIAGAAPHHIMATNINGMPIGYSDKRAENIDLTITNANLYWSIYNALRRMAIATFEWEGLPDTCDRRTLEMALADNGSAMIYQPDGTDIWMTSRWIPGSGGYDGYGNIIDPVAIDYNGRNIKPGDGRWAILYDSDTRTSIMATIDIHARLIYETMQTFRQNLRHQNTPYIVTGGRNDVTNIKAFFKRLLTFDPVIEVKSLNQGEDISNKISTVDTRVEYRGIELLETRDKVWDNAISELGIASEAAKKERLLTDEISMNRQEDMIALNCRLLPRIEFCDRVNSQFGLNLSVNIAGSAVSATAMMDREADLGRADETENEDED